MLFYFTTLSLDIVGAVSWWVVSKATHGIYNGIYYIAFGSNTQKEHIQLEPNETLQLLVQESIQQKEQITKLNENIIILSNYIKQHESNSETRIGEIE
jgi:hypothetical protein